MFKERKRAWLAKTHGTQFELVRHFLGHHATSDSFSSFDQVRRLMIGVLVLVGAVEPLIAYIYHDRGKYQSLHRLTSPDLYNRVVQADHLFFIALSMIVAGLVTVTQWQKMFPDGTDYFVFKPLPVRLYQIFLARFLAGLLVVAVILADLNILASVIFPCVSSGQWQSPAFGVQSIVVHAVVTFGAGFFVFFALAALQGMLLNILSARLFGFFSVFMQAAFATAFVAAIPFVVDIPNMVQGERPYWMLFFPPAWFLGLYETLLGNPDPYFVRMSAIAIKGFGLVLFVGLLGYVLSYYRHASRVLEPNQRGKKESFVHVLGKKLLYQVMPNAREQGVFSFVVKTLARSRQHRLILSFLGGIALVLAINTAGPVLEGHFWSVQAWEDWQLQAVVAAPMLIGTIMVLSLCYAAQLPVALNANWIFRMAESGHRREFLNSMEHVLIICGVLPAVVVTFPAEAFALGWRLALANTPLMTVVMLLLTEFKLSAWNKIPFACSYIPGEQNIWLLAGKYLVLFGTVIPLISWIDVQLLHPVRLVVATVAVWLVYWRVRGLRMERWGVYPILFDEVEDGVIGGMQLEG